MNNRLVFLFCLLAGLSSCMHDEIDSSFYVDEPGLAYMEFTVAAGADTRTQLSGENKVTWQSGDAISIFDGTANRKFTTTQSGESVVFTGEAKKADAYYALYPYQENAKLDGNTIKYVTIPNVQEVSSGSFDASANISVAQATSDLQLAFKNVGSLVRFSVSNSQATLVRTVKLISHDESEVLSGVVDITVGSAPSAAVKTVQEEPIMLNTPNGLQPGVEYFMAVLPETLSQGFTLSFMDGEGKGWLTRCASPEGTQRSKILKTDPIEIGEFAYDRLTNKNLIAVVESMGETLNFNKNKDGSVSLLDAKNFGIVQKVIFLDLSGKNDPTICDEIGLFTNLTYLYCGINQLTSLDVSKNTALTSLDCHNNQLSSLDVSKNTALTDLSCGNNQLTSLDISQNIQLELSRCILGSQSDTSHTNIELTLYVNSTQIGQTLASSGNYQVNVVLKQ